MKIYNSLTRKIEELETIIPGKLGMYTCGPTVYSTPTIGNFRTYTSADILVRALKFLGYQVKYVMNITDVGHLTGDNLGDADTGEDRLEKAAKKEGKDAWEIAAGYTQEFLSHMQALNILSPEVMCKATDHIKEQIEMVAKLEERGLVYKIADGIYFDTQAFEKLGYKYGELSTLDSIKEGARVEVNPDKKDPRDFALWKLSPKNEKRQMEWESPWGVGFPGWHIECSAMSTKYLGEQFEIHAGGEDLRSTHHPNEIAQAEGASGKHPFVRYWVHGAFLLVDGGRMGKSLGNAYTITDIENKGIDPLALRYFYMTGHYRKQLNFTWEALQGAMTALTRLRKIYEAANKEVERVTLSPEKLDQIEKFASDFRLALEQDLDMPGALAVVWEVAKSNIPGPDKRDLLQSFDQVLGLSLDKVESAETEIPDKVVKMAAERLQMRLAKNWAESDRLRDEIKAMGYMVDDKADGSYAITALE